MNSQRVVLCTLVILIVITPVIAVINFDLSKEPTLWILKTESGDSSIDIGLDEIKLSL